MNDKWGAQTTGDEVLAGIDLTGKHVLVTGASGGLGLETSTALARKGATVILAARDPEKLDAACRKILQEVPGAALEILLLDLASLSSIRNAADECLARFRKIDILVNNAGIMFCPLMRTQDNFEMQFGVCHLGHFLFTCRIVPALMQGQNPRIINLTSGGHVLGDVDFDDPNFHSRPYDKWQSYGQAKSANVLFSVELEQRLSRYGIHANAVHPGMILETELGRHLGNEDYEYLMAMGNPEDFTIKSIQSGVATTLWAATSPELKDRGGLYLEDCHVSSVNDDGTGSGGFLSRVIDPVRAKKLWTLSEQLVGEKFF